MSKIGRRSILVSLVLTTLSATVYGDDSDWRSVLAEEINERSPLTLGHIFLPPDDKRWNEVDSILDHAPLGTPYSIAKYFIQNVPAQYQQAWPEPDHQHPTFANPLITRLFLATGTSPNGDMTPWCAAFVNWCLMRAHIPGMRAVGSQTFRNWGSSVWQKGEAPLPVEARTGDIAIFRSQSDPDHGHVAFFSALSKTQPRHIEILGGNQIRRTSRGEIHLINLDSWRVDGDPELVAIRTSRGLRNE